MMSCTLITSSGGAGAAVGWVDADRQVGALNVAIRTVEGRIIILRREQALGRGDLLGIGCGPCGRSSRKQEGEVQAEAEFHDVTIADKVART